MDGEIIILFYSLTECILTHDLPALSAADISTLWLRRQRRNSLRVIHTDREEFSWGGKS